ncbi:MAG: hypothetical protein HZB15_05105 [Actinobacteria bacterium]|nr:hypothetical protein [Actinomycetota bacterium]
MNDELRQRIAGIDPARDVTIDPINGDRARTLLENIMSDTLTPNSLDADSTTPPVRHRHRRRWWSALAGGAAVAAAAVGIVAVNGGGGTAPVAAPPVVLAVPAPDAMAMCMAIDATILGDVDLAFGGTVTEVGDGTVTLEVDRWYEGGGDATTVQLTTPPNFTAALDGVDFVAGGRFLVTATGGQVNSCGMSGAATPELEQLFEQAFA